MSYILEALKKLEQKRQEQERRRPPSFVQETTRKRRKRPVWPYALAAVLLVNAGVFAWWLIPWRQGTPATAVRGPTATVTQKPGVRQEAGDRQPNAVADVKPPSRAAQAGKVAVPPTAPPAQETPRVARAEKPSAATSKAAVEKAVPERQAVRKRNIPDPACTVAELPPFIREALPRFNVTGHAYSPDPRTRVARVNDKVLLEGQELQPGLKVEEIIADGIVFTFQGYRFRVPAG